MVSVLAVTAYAVIHDDFTVMVQHETGLTYIVKLVMNEYDIELFSYLKKNCRSIIQRIYGPIENWRPSFKMTKDT